MAPRFTTARPHPWSTTGTGAIVTRTASSTITTARTTRSEAASTYSMAHNRAQQSDSTDIGMDVAWIDTSVRLSQRTLDALVHSESHVELSQAAVP
ncbi:unnamed protein product [Phytophthora fragariaefolia]|uniref:Unnamed protein product n=1 Tax=Phytophthora fragariaefolia TaxID=1490495 RepID=A0A9W7DB29_9STRA|nr:unnamed protein product [Phytophthora fragariaefolia]